MISQEPLLCALAIINGVTLEIRHGSLLDLKKIDVIVNAANNKLGNLGGLAGQLVYSGGVSIQEECDVYIKKNRMVKPGCVVVTTAGTLNFKNIIHTVGPIAEDHTENVFIKRQLFKAIFQSILEAEKTNSESIGIPAISCGTFGYPIGPAALRHIEAFIVFAGQHKVMNGKSCVTKVVFCLFTDNEISCFLDALWGRYKAFSFINFEGQLKDR